MTAALGFVGLGQMGAAMAEKLIAADRELHIYDPADSAVEAFVDMGAVAHRSPREVADCAEIIIACLPNFEACEAVTLGRDGIIHGTATKTYVETSTIGPEAAKGLAEHLRSHGIGMVDAPVTGGPAVARAGKLTIMASGESVHVRHALPALERMAGKLCVLGEQAGQGQLMKLINNLIMASNMVIASEGLVLGAKAGLDSAQMFEVLSAGSGQSFAARILEDTVLDRTFDFGAHMSIIVKDMALGLAQASASGTPSNVMEATAAIWGAAKEAQGGAADFSRLICLLEQEAGVVVQRLSEPAGA